MKRFASGPRKHYYGKGDVTVYRLNRDYRTPDGQSPVFAASVLMLVYGEAFWRTYTDGDNTGLIATDSMKNFIQRETLNFGGYDLESFCHFLASTFRSTYPQVEGVQVSARELPFASLPSRVGFSRSDGEHQIARLELRGDDLLEISSGIIGFRLLRLGGSAFSGFVRDRYTTLPETLNRPLHMWLDAEWRYTAPEHAFTQGRAAQRVRDIIQDVFEANGSGSIQEVIHRMATRMLADLPEVAEVHLEAQNRTWDTIAERDSTLGVWTDPRPPFGCIGLRLSRE